MAAALASLIPALIGSAAPAISTLVGNVARGKKTTMRMKTPEELSSGEGCKRRGRGFKSFGKSMVNNPIMQGMLFNTGMDLSGRLINGLFPQSGNGCSKSKKNYRLSHGLGVPPPIPFGGMINPKYPAMSVANRPTMNIATRGVAPSIPQPPHQGIVSTLPRPHNLPVVKSGESGVIATTRPSHMSHIPSGVLGSQPATSNFQPKLPNNSSMNQLPPGLVRPTMRPPLSSKPSNFIPKVKKLGSKVKRLGVDTFNKARSLGKLGLKKLKHLKHTLPGTLKELSHPKQYSRKLARKGAIKSQNLINKLNSKVKNPKVKRLLNKSQKVINAVDRYGQRGNMGSKPYNISKKLAKIGNKLKPKYHAGKHFAVSKLKTLSKKLKGHGMPYLPGPLA